MFTGYSSLAWAEALPHDGQLLTLDINPETAEIAKRYFKESPYGHKIELKLGPALETLKTLQGPFDLCFIDADKTAGLPRQNSRGLDGRIRKGNSYHFLVPQPLSSFSVRLV